MDGIQARLRAAAAAGGRGLVLAVVSLVGSLLLFVLSVLSLVFVVLGVGLLTTPPVLRLVQEQANRRRLLAAEWSDVRISASYRPFPADLRSGLPGQVQRCSLLLKDPATWRDLLWLPVDMIFGFATAVLTAALLLYPLEGLALAAGLWRVFEGGGYWYGFVPISGQGSGFAAAALGLVILAVGLYAAPLVLRAHFLIAKSVLAPGRDAELARRIDHLTETRHEAVDASAAELRRIERDLHDGAQARLVAMGMDLGTVEALIERNPAQAKVLLAQARKSSAEALTELRDLVRGIHPPVLAERGLGDAVKALVLRLPLRTDVDAELPGRLGASVESAAYFAISELLTNAVKHAEADRVWVDLRYADGSLRIAVTDDGRGGARIGAGSGLSGLERRLGTFDGVLAVSSPAGGPTMVTMEIPCELS
ncbi:sensor histidine kinase [Streptomyces monticola]|uniref:histidine kinase n=1 Tax=Streptomyces monticola TaxID=2666263 RepID=A0ABW2JUP5_9ACTN